MSVQLRRRRDRPSFAGVRAYADLQVTGEQRSPVGLPVRGASHLNTSVPSHCRIGGAMLRWTGYAFGRTPMPGRAQTSVDVRPLLRAAESSVRWPRRRQALGLKSDIDRLPT